MLEKSRRGTSALIALAAVALVGTLPAAGAGFAIFEAGSKATAMSGAFVASSNDPSSMFYNPAGNAWDNKLTGMGGVTLIFPSSDFTGASPYPGNGYAVSQKKQIFFPPHFYGVIPVAPKFNIALGTWFPYGLSTAWENPDSFPGRYLSQRVDLRTYALGLQASYRITDEIAIGAGPELRIGDVKLQRNVPFLNPLTNRIQDIAHADIVGDGFQSALGWAAGVQVKPFRNFSVGLSYHSAVDIDFEGNSTFYRLQTGNPYLDGVLSTRVPFDTKVPTAVTIQFPSLTMFGVAYKMGDLTLEVDGNYTTWDVFDKTVLTFETTNGVKVADSILEHHWENTWTIRAGANYQASPSFNLAAGFVYDQTPQPDEDVSPLLPDANRTGFSIGFGYKMGESTVIEASNLFLFFHDRTTNSNKDNYNGTYQTFADLFVLSFRTSF